MSVRHVSELPPQEKGAAATSLARPLHFPFSGRVAPNRFLKAAMTEHLASWDPLDRKKCGIPGEGLARLYRRWGQGQAGVILTGNIMVDQDSLETKGNMILPAWASVPSKGTLGVDASDNEARFEGYKQIATAGKAEGSLIIGQLSHPGRQTTKDINPDPVSASDVELMTGSLHRGEYAKPHPATQEEIDAIVEAFIHGAQYLESAGFDGVELHGAHGYLLAQFLAKRTNRRQDAYGGSIEKRTKIIVDIARGIRSKCRPSFVLGMKLNSAEFQEDGLQPEESAAICLILERQEFDFVELSGGTAEKLGWEYTRESTRQRESWFLHFAEQIVPSLKETKSYITGGFKTVNAMSNALKTVDGVGLGRALAGEPDLPKHVISGKVESTINSGFDSNDFTMSGGLAGAHMRQMSEGREPFDPSQEGEVARYSKAAEEWMGALAKGEFVSWPYVE